MTDNQIYKQLPL